MCMYIYVYIHKRSGTQGEVWACRTSLRGLSEGRALPTQSSVGNRPRAGTLPLIETDRPTLPPARILPKGLSPQKGTRSAAVVQA